MRFRFEITPSDRFTFPNNYLFIRRAIVSLFLRHFEPTRSPALFAFPPALDSGLIAF